MLPSTADQGSGLRFIIRDIWAHRDLLLQFTRRDIRIRYKQAIMGFAWALLLPLMVLTAGLTIRFAMAQYAGRHVGLLDIAGMAVKTIPWAFFVGSINFATNSLVTNSQLVTKVAFPREVLPLASVLAQMLDSSVSTIAIVLVLLVVGVKLTLAVLWVPVLVAILVLFTVGAALLLSCANLFFRDVKYIVQVLLTFGIFFTPVLIEPAMLGPLGAKLIMLNPLAPILEGLRLSVTQGHNLLEPLVTLTKSGAQVLEWTPRYLLYSATWAIGGAIRALRVFHRYEFVFAEYV